MSQVGDGGGSIGSPQHLRQGELLFRAGSEGDDVWIVDHGQLEVLAPSQSGVEVVVGELGPGDIVGEITAAIGGTRTATVRAGSDCALRRMDATGFDHWLRENPDRSAAVFAQARERIDRTRVARAVADLVGTDNKQLIDELTAAVDWVSVPSGDTLFAQGEESDAAYILVAGQLRVLATDAEGNTTLDTRVGRGDLIGEMGVIEQAPRSAAAIAIRDCTLARLKKETFEEFTARYPAMMIPLVRTVVQRVARRDLIKPHAGMIAIVDTSPDPDRNLVPTLVDEIRRFGTTEYLNVDRIAEFMQRRGIAQAARGSAAETRLNDFIHEVDIAHRWLLVECDRFDSDWSERILRSADRVVLVHSARPDATEAAAMDAIRDLLRSIGEHDLWIAPVRRGATPSTTRLLERTGASRVIHLRSRDDRSYRRLARLMSGNGLGLALSGGGARSFAQLGVIRALSEHGHEVDAIAGTSMGSVIGGFLSLCDDPSVLMDRGREAFVGKRLLDYTLPISSLMTGRRISEAIEEQFGAYDVTDTQVPFRCMSTNLTRSCLVEHRSGNLAKAIRASVSLPGVFPPVVHDGELLVDGGVLENLPARPLRLDDGIGTVVAADVAPPGGPRAKVDYGMSLSARDVVAGKIRGEPGHPALAATVMSSMLVGSSGARMASLERGDIDLYVSLNMTGVSLLDFSAMEEAAERGYRDSVDQVRAWSNAQGSAQ